MRMFVAILLLAGVPMLGGCLRSKPSVATMSGDPDIVAVLKFYSQAPWLSFDEAGDPNPEGFKVNLYLISSHTRKGAFGFGDIVVSMYAHEPPPASRDNQPQPPELVKQWVLDPLAAMPYRATREGVFYLPPLQSLDHQGMQTLPYILGSGYFLPPET